MHTHDGQAYGLVSVDGPPKTNEEKAAELLAEFDQMTTEQKRVALAGVLGVDPNKAVLVRKSDGTMTIEEVSYESRARILGMQAAGFQSVSFGNRKQKRALKAVARRAPEKRSP